MFIVYIIKSKIKMSGGYKRTHENGYDKRKKNCISVNNRDRYANS